MRTKVNGFDMTYEDTGATATPLVLVHGFPLDHTVWVAQTRGLADVARVIAPDLRGCGGSGTTSGAVTIEAYADDIVALMDALGVQRAIVGGLSMGGYIAFALYKKYHERVRGLVFADTKPGADSADGKKGRDDNIALVREQGARAIAEKMLPKMLTPDTISTRPAVADAVRDLMARQPVNGIIAQLGAMRDRPDSTPVMAQIDVPTLIVTGADDTLIPPKEAEAMRNAIRGAQLVSIPQAAHLANFERPEAFNDAVRDFVKGMTSD